MTDRVEALGGHLEVSSAVGVGTRVSGSIPLDGQVQQGRVILPPAAAGAPPPRAENGDAQAGQAPESDELAAASAAERRR
jgi:hypothetical protein